MDSKILLSGRDEQWCAAGIQSTTAVRAAGTRRRDARCCSAGDGAARAAATAPARMGLAPRVGASRPRRRHPGGAGGGHHARYTILRFVFQGIFIALAAFLPPVDVKRL